MLGLAAAALFWEQIWPRLWPVTAIGLIFVSVALFDVLPQLPFLLHWLILLGFAVVLLVRLRPLLGGDYHINDDQRRQRLERDSGLLHRPLSALDDKPLSEQNDGPGIHIWQAHQRRMLEKLNALRVRAPAPGMAAKDPFAVRMVVVLVSVLAIGTGWNDAGSRLARAVMPHAEGTVSADLKLDVWITPPTYTGLAPVFLERAIHKEPVAGTAEPAVKNDLEIPVGSTILAQVSGSQGVPEIDLAGRRITLPIVGKTAEGGGYRGEAEVIDADRKADTLSIMIESRVLASWPVRIAVDRPPVVEFVDPPKRIGQANLALRFEARDDFALKDVWATIQESGAQVNSQGNNQIRIELPASGLGTALAKGQSRHDYSAHPWAGTEVLISLIAEDAKGQVGKSDPFKMVLPERTFNHPVARALVEQRKKLNTPDERTVARVIYELDMINTNPAHYFHDTVVFLNIAVARARLQHDREPGAVGSVQKQLWETALRIEDGEFAVADKDLRDAQERLAKAMRDGATPEQLDRLMAELQAALDKYMSALAEHLQRQGLSEMPMNPSARAMESGDLQRMIEQTRDLAKTGAMDAAREMLARLNRMLDSIRDGVRMAPPNGKMAEARKMMDELRGLAQRQQQLLDQTFREMQKQDDDSGPLPQLGNGAMPPMGNQGQQGQPSDEGQRSQGAGKSGGPLQGMARQQKGLRGELGRLMLQMDKMLGSIPGGLGKADRAMKGAGKALGEGDAGTAVPNQTEALDQLRKATNQAAEQLAKQMQGQIGLAPGMPGQRPGQRREQGRDPFGRPGGGAHGGLTDDGAVKVPSERDILRAREILDELHRRAGEQSRPQMEREFIDRLLRRF